MREQLSSNISWKVLQSKLQTSRQKKCSTILLDIKGDHRRKSSRHRQIRTLSNSISTRNSIQTAQYEIPDFINPVISRISIQNTNQNHKRISKIVKDEKI